MLERAPAQDAHAVLSKDSRDGVHLLGRFDLRPCLDVNAAVEVDASDRTHDVESFARSI